MFSDIASIVVLGACVWGVLNPQVKTRTAGTFVLSLIGILALVNLL